MSKFNTGIESNLGTRAESALGKGFKEEFLERIVFDLKANGQ